MILRIDFRMQEQPPTRRGQTNTDDPQASPKLIGDLVSYGEIALKVNGNLTGRALVNVF